MSTYKEEFLIAKHSKELFVNLYDLLANVPKRDYFIKDEINNSMLLLIKYVYEINFLAAERLEVVAKLKTQISLLDFYLGILYNKKYISEKQYEKQISKLTEITKMVTVWIRNKELRDVKWNSDF